MKKSLRVGVFDSGIGGLTVLDALTRRLPDVRFYYLGDNRRAPYGSRPPEEIYRFVRAAVARFCRLGADAVVLACNTATAVCADRLRREFSIPIVGIEPAVLAARASKRPLLLCTPRTAESDRLKALLSRAPGVTVFPAPRLAGEIERALTSGGAVDLASHLPKGDFDGVILGCTHYSFLAKEISAFYSAPVFDGNEGVARRLASVLAVERKWSEIQKTNVCFDSPWRNKAKSGVVFLGKTRKINEKVYKQTFGKRFLTKKNGLRGNPWKFLGFS